MVANDTRVQATVLSSGARKLMIGVTAWVLLQIPRVVAVTLIASVNNGEDAAAWMYPAILDVVCAVAAPFLAVALWKWRGLATWTLTIVYLTVSIVDHVGFFTTSAQIGTPIAFEDMGGGSELVPAIQTTIDAVFLFLVVRSKEIFFKLAQTAA